MKPAMNCSIFADAVIEGLGWPPAFEAHPLLRSALELAAAWGFRKFERGDFGAAPLPGMFADRVASIMDNDVAGKIDVLPGDAWSNRSPVRQLFKDAVAAGFEAVLQGKNPGAAVKRAGKATSPKAGGKRRQPRKGTPAAATAKA